jgi:hypothetical protein
MSRQKAKAVKATAKRGKKLRSGTTFGVVKRERTVIKIPKRTGYVHLHIPDLYNEDISWCHHVKMDWQHLICVPSGGESMSELKALRVCGRCVNLAAWYYNFID